MTLTKTEKGWVRESFTRWEKNVIPQSPLIKKLYEMWMSVERWLKNHEGQN